MAAAAPKRSSSPPVTSAVGVQSLRAMFEKKTRAQTPAEFLAAQKQLAEKEAAEVLLARKKAAAFNMALRQMELSKEVEAAVKTNEQKEKREKLRAEARRVSTVLRQLDQAPTRPAEESVQRRATTMMMAEMAEELEREMKIEEERVKEEEELAGKLKEEADAVAMAEAARKAEEARKEAEEMARIAREEAEKMATAEAEEAAKKEKAESEQHAAKAAKAAAAAADRERAELEAKAKADAELRAKLEAEEKDRHVLTSYLQENYPEKLSEVDSLLEKFKGNLDVLFEELGKGQRFAESKDDGASVIETDEQPAAPASSDAKAAAAAAPAPSTGGGKKFLNEGVDVRQVITLFYQMYAASKLNDIDDILKHFANREADLFRTLEVKYDVTFSTDGTCIPNDGDRIGGPEFIAATASGHGPEQSKFAVDVQKFTLQERLAKQGQSSDKIQAVMSGGSQMM